MVDRADEEEDEDEAEDVDADGSVAGLTTWRRPPRGRPSLSGRGGPSPRLLVRLPAELHAQVVRAAVQQQLSVARWTRRAVEDALTRQQDAPFLRRRTRWSVRPLPYETGRMLVVVLAGGASSRMGGGDKTRTRLGGRALLDHVLGWLPEETCVVVGDKRPLAVGREVHWCRERPPGSGPVAAVRAALDAAWDRTLPVLRWSDDEVLLLAGDAPFAPRAAARLRVALAADRHADVAMLVDDHGRRQHLCAVWRWSSLKAAVSDSSRRSMRSLLEGRQVVEVPARHGEAQDCDEAADLAVLDAILRGT